MKTLLLILSLTFSTFAQTKIRYFQATFVGEGVGGNIRYGTFFYTTTGKFLDINECLKLITDAYKVKFQEPPAITITEFKNKSEWLKLNQKFK